MSKVRRNDFRTEGGPVSAVDGDELSPADPGASGWRGHRSVISPIPAQARTSRIPATAAGLVSNSRETAITVPSAAFNRNLYSS
ncbi:hypothetical protein HNP00_000154 [Arthrobacter sp. AZCC_0090]|nr:hypothetical protein [Arthrobacter sp. AZCC_0090]